MALNTLLIFAKYAEAGLVKTRMVPPLTPTEAADLHEASLCTVCERVATLAGVEVKLVVTPDGRLDAVRKMTPPLAGDFWPQGDGDLGDRLARAVRRAFDGGTDGVLLLGADSPTVPIEFFNRATASLVDHDAVLGASEDGGYYLLALSRPVPSLFQGVAWGGPNVAEETRARAESARLRWIELPIWYDLDRFEDLKRARRDLGPASTTGSAGVALRQLIGRLVKRYPPHPHRNSQ